METRKVEKTIAYCLRYAGVFGRNRTVKSGHYRLAQVPAGESIPPLELTKLAFDHLQSIKLKSGNATWNISEDPVDVETYTDESGRTVKIEKHMLFSGRLVNRGEW